MVAHYSYLYFCTTLFFFVLAALGAGFGIAAFVRLDQFISKIEAELHWEIDEITGNIISKDPSKNVEIKSENDLIFHNRVVHCGNATAIELIQLTPVIPLFPPGPDFLFGDQSITYTRMQAGLAIGFRLAAANVQFPLLFEPGLQVLIEPLGVHIATPFFSVFGTFIASDERIKTDITDMDTKEAAENVMKIKPRTYYYIPEYNEIIAGKDSLPPKSPKRRGFIAQEVEQILPNSVQEESMNLPNEKIEDFKQLSLEDIIVENVGAQQHIIFFSVYQLGYDFFRNKDERLTQIFECFTTDPFPSLKNKAACICKQLSVACKDNEENIFCSSIHPLNMQCIIAFP